MLDCVIDVDKWANQVFGSCQLGDARRTKRLVDVAKRHALTPSAAPLEACSRFADGVREIDEVRV